MNAHDATEAAYRNGYAAGQVDAKKSGHWEYFIGVDEKHGFCSIVECSNCEQRLSLILGGQTILLGELDEEKLSKEFNYCPHCGAKMEEIKEE